VSLAELDGYPRCGQGILMNKAFGQNSGNEINLFEGEEKAISGVGGPTIRRSGSR
jgi:hypothetical protein